MCQCDGKIIMQLILKIQVIYLNLLFEVPNTLHVVVECLYKNLELALLHQKQNPFNTSNCPTVKRFHCIGTDFVDQQYRKM